MIGTGVFTTSGLLLDALGSPVAVIVAWVLGGVLAAAGALSYAELVAALPRNGGEYQLLTRIYHPAVGFGAGVISFVVGFAAPLAASALAFGHYAAAAVPAIRPRPRPSGPCSATSGSRCRSAPASRSWASWCFGRVSLTSRGPTSRGAIR
jgi:APA family basic amino acid/polyamine antiporter